MALMAYGAQLYFFSGPSGAVSRYDVSTKELQPLGLLDQAIVGAGAPACVATAGVADAGAESAATEAGAGSGPEEMSRAQVVLNGLRARSAPPTGWRWARHRDGGWPCRQ